MEIKSKKNYLAFGVKTIEEKTEKKSNIAVMQKVTFTCATCGTHNISFLHFCTDEELEKIIAAKTCTHYKKGQTIFDEDTQPLGLYCVNKGVIKLTRSNKEGKEQIIRFAKESDFLGYRALIAEEPLVSSATCLEDTLCCFIPKNIFLELIDSNPEINKQMVKALSHDLGMASEKIQSLAQKSVRERLAETLLFLQQTFKNGQSDETTIAVTLPCEDLANIVGTATETVIRLLTEFKNDKLIEIEGKRIRVVNKEKLEKISHASV